MLCSSSGVASPACDSVGRDMHENEDGVVSTVITATVVVLPPRATDRRPSSSSPSLLHLQVDLGHDGERQGGGGGGEGVA